MITTKASRLNNLAHTLAPWTLPVLLLAVWQLSVSAGWLSTRILPAPSAVFAAGVELVRSGEIWKHLAISGWRAGLGFVIGGSIGLALGFITGLSKWGERLLDSSVQMIRNVPHLALIPLVILWFGIDESAKIFWSRWARCFPFTSIPITASATLTRRWWRWRAAMACPVSVCFAR